MNQQLPVEGQKVEVRLEGGEWQEAVYKHEIFTDSFGLALDSGKILEWRAMASLINGAGQMRRGVMRVPESQIQ